jgi:uncharacterized membrane protein
MFEGGTMTSNAVHQSDRNYHQPETVDELTQRNVQAIAQLEAATNAQRSFSDRVAEAIANFCGSMAFVWVHIVWFGGWILVNVLPGLPHFDKFPFTFLTLVVSLEAIFLSTFILISQNHDTKLSEQRNHLDLQINLLSEQENTKMLKLLDQIATKVGVKSDDDPAITVLEEATRPDKLGEQIEETIKATDTPAAQGK